MTVTEHFQLGRFGQVTLSQGGRLEQPTNVVAPGAAGARAPGGERPAQDHPRRRDAGPEPRPDRRSPAAASRSRRPTRSAAATPPPGSSASSTTRGAATPPAPTPTASARSTPSAARRLRAGQPAADERRPPSVATTRVVGMNLLNFFNTLDTSGNNCRGGVTGAAMDCRGANTADEFDRQWRKTVAAVSGTQADVVAFMEMENDGYGPDSAEQFLVDKLNDEGRRRHVGVHRRRRPHRPGRRPRQRRHQGRHALQAGRGDAGRARPPRSTPTPSSPVATPARATVRRSRRRSATTPRAASSSPWPTT